MCVCNVLEFWKKQKKHMLNIFHVIIELHLLSLRTHFRLLLLLLLLLFLDYIDNPVFEKNKTMFNQNFGHVYVCFQTHNSVPLEHTYLADGEYIKTT